ncbi:MtrAB system accessory lipoprotein LpqB [Nocardioides kribbensis]
MTRPVTRPVTSRARALLAVLALLLVGPLATACVGLPDEGPVVEAGTGSSTSDEGAAPAIDPPAPQPGMSAAEVVEGFLAAMQASPIDTATASEYLTREAAAAWNPQQATITYDDRQLPQGSTRVVVALTGAAELDARGAWQGRLSAARSQLAFTVRVEDGDLRISDPPDALVVPDSWFDQRFRQVSLYFVDPLAEILVPEPVYAPVDDTFASSLVEGLVEGPGRGASGVSSTFLPPGLEVDLSVPVSEDGVAQVSLTGPATPPTSERETELLLAQLAWTLRQDPRIEAVQLSVNGQPVRLPGGDGRFSVTEGALYSPVGFQSSSLLYGLRDGLLVSGGPDTLAPVDGPLGSRAVGVSSVAVNLTATTVAGVVDGGTSLVTAPVRGSGKVVRVVPGATDLLTPAWDHSDRLWLVDRGPDGADVSVLVGERRRSVTVPGVSGSDVRRFLVSRDASRVVAVVRGPQRDRLLVSRVRYDDRGQVLRVTRPVQLRPDEGSRGRIVDVAWRSPTSLAVMQRLGPETTRVGAVGVDGSPPGPEGLSVTLGRASGLAGSPVTGEVLYALTPDGLVDLTGLPTAARPLADGVGSLAYVG